MPRREEVQRILKRTESSEGWTQLSHVWETSQEGMSPNLGPRMTIGEWQVERGRSQTAKGGWEWCQPCSCCSCLGILMLVPLVVQPLWQPLEKGRVHLAQWLPESVRLRWFLLVARLTASGTNHRQADVHSREGLSGSDPLKVEDPL